MAEYIEKQLVLSKSQQDYLEGRYDYDDFVLVSDIESIPPADVRPVVRGRWIVHMYEMFPADSTIECDQCHEEQSAFISDSFCPNCWADMREVGTEAIKRNTTKIVEKANGIYAEYIRHLQEKNKALDEELASLLNEADAGIKGR